MIASRESNKKVTQSLVYSSKENVGVDLEVLVITKSLDDRDNVLTNT